MARQLQLGQDAVQRFKLAAVAHQRGGRVQPEGLLLGRVVQARQERVVAQDAQLHDGVVDAHRALLGRAGGGGGGHGCPRFLRHDAAQVRLVAAGRAAHQHLALGRQV